MSSLEYTPDFSTKEVTDLIKTLYGFDSHLSSLPSERDQNFKVKTTKGERYVLKIANASESRSFLEAQNLALERLSDRFAFCPEVIPTQTGVKLVVVKSKEGIDHLVRMVSYLSGTPMGLNKRRSKALYRDFGRGIAQIDEALAGFTHPSLERDFHWDLAKAGDVIQKYKQEIGDPEILVLVDECYLQFKKHTSPLLGNLRRSAIHGDLNDYNVLVGGGEDLYSSNQFLTGVIDFGDLILSYTVADLAIAVAYAVLDSQDPLKTAMEIIGGFHEIYPLQEDEVEVLFNLICMRLCVSACMAAVQLKQRPDDEYLSISQEPIRKMLPKLLQISPEFAEAAFRLACGMSPLKDDFSVLEWIENNQNRFFPLLGEPLNASECLVLDLSVETPYLSGDPSLRNNDKVATSVANALDDANATFGIGQFGEYRLFQTSFLEEEQNEVGGQSSTYHLAMELITVSAVSIHAPLDGIVHRIRSADKNGTSCCSVILKHQTDQGNCFYTSYSNLDYQSVVDLAEGEELTIGTPFARTAERSENGGRPIHLQFQVISGFKEITYLPGACFPSHKEIWQAFILNPNKILQVPSSCFPDPKPGKTETQKKRQQLVSQNLSIGYQNPIKVVRGWQQFLYDEKGRSYLDAYNNVPHVGHCHPEVIEAGFRQMNCLNTNTRYLHDTLNQYAEELSETMPEPLDVCFFLNSASEANELALRLARAHTAANDMIVLEGAYHGNTNTLIDISPYKHDGPGGKGAPGWVHTAPVADGYRGLYKYSDPEIAEKYASHVQEIVNRLDHSSTKLAGFIAESYPSVGGQIVFPAGYLAKVYEIIRKSGGLCIADEVQTGYGRTGSHFYAFEAQGAIPDIVVLGKPIGNGHPIGAVVTTQAIAESFSNGMEFFSTFGGSTVSCAIGLKTLEITLRNRLQENALKVGNHLLERLHPLKNQFQIVGDVRGAGLFIGIELVRDRKTLEPAGDETSFIANRMRDKGVLVGTDGPWHNVLKIRPPLVINKADADRIADCLEEVLMEDFSS